VTGEEYPPSSTNQLLSTLLGVAQIVVVVLITFGETIFQKLEMPIPPIVAQMQENKLMVGIGSFLLGNMIRGQLLATGAFEVFFDGELVFSKLQTGQMIDESMMVSLLQSYKVV